MNTTAHDAALTQLRLSSPLILALDPSAPATLRARPLLSPALPAAFYTFLILPFFVPRFPYRRSVFITLEAALLASILRCQTGAGPALDYLYMTTCWWLFQRFLDFWGVCYPPEENPIFSLHGKGRWRDLGFGERLRFVVEIYQNARGVGCEWGNGRLPKAEVVTDRWMFVLRGVLHWVAMMALLLPMYYFYLTPEEALVRTWKERFFWNNICALGIYISLSGYYRLIGALSVALGITTPNQWPPIFGKLKEAYTIRRAWGAFWHQMLTRSFLSISSHLATSLGLQKGRKTTYLFRIYVAFFMSGLLHAVPAWTISHTDGGLMAYFMAQAVAVTVEEVVWRPLGRVLGVGRKVERVLAWTWTLAWFMATNVGFVDGYIAIGIMGMVERRGWGVMVGK